MENDLSLIANNASLEPEKPVFSISVLAEMLKFIKEP